MSLTPSTMLALGTTAPDFSLPTTGGKTVSLSTFTDSKLLVVMFICNHCPYVKHIQKGLVEVANDYQAKGVGFVAINSNDADNYPEDSFEMMEKEIELAGYPFLYAYDEDQSVAKAYNAACTPDIYVFDGERKLVYRGQLDDSRPGNDKPVTGQDLRASLDALLQDAPVSQDQKPSTGCNIKWKSGNAPDYF